MGPNHDFWYHLMWQQNVWRPFCLGSRGGRLSGRKRLALQGSRNWFFFPTTPDCTLTWWLLQLGCYRKLQEIGGVWLQSCEPAEPCMRQMIISSQNRDKPCIRHQWFRCLRRFQSSRLHFTEFQRCFVQQTSNRLNRPRENLPFWCAPNFIGHG